MYVPLTDSLRQALLAAGTPQHQDDLAYLERWERDPEPGAAAALRMVQLRRANPELAARIRHELSACARAGDRRQV